MSGLPLSSPTSLKECIQSMTPNQLEIISGKVTQVSPLRIQAVNDEKLILNENTAIVPRHLTDCTIKIDIELDGGSIYSNTLMDGTHPHGPSGGHPQYSGSGIHSHPASEGAHINWLQTFNIYGATIKNYNALRVGDRVSILCFNHGKKYYVLDREG